MARQGIGPFFLPARSLREWLVSRWASRFFFVSAICVVALIPVFGGVVDTTKMSFLQRLPGALLGVVGPVAIFCLWLGMWIYWVRLDDSSQWPKRVWFLVLLFGFWYGSVLYYFVVYLQQMTRRGRPEV